MWWSVFTLSQKATTAYRPLGSSKRKWTWKERRSSANEYWNLNRDLNWALGLNERPLVPSTNQNVNFLWFEGRRETKKSQEIPLWKGNECSILLPRQNNVGHYECVPIPDRFRIRSAHGTLSVRTCLWADFLWVSLFLCFYQQKKWDSFHCFPGPQRPGLRSCRILFSEFGTFSLSPESCRCWSEIADYHHIVPILYTNLMDQELRRNKDPWFWRFSTEKKRFSDYTI